MKNKPQVHTTETAQETQANEAWQRRYENGKTGWDRGAPNPALSYWLDRGALRPGRILIPGCGNGYEVIALSQRGFEVTGVDIAPWPLQALRTRLENEHLRAEIVEADIFQWEPTQTFDAIYEQTCLCAITPEERAEYAARLSTWLPPGGRLFAMFMQTRNRRGPPYHCDIETMRALFPAHLWSWPDAEAIKVPHTIGHELGYVLQRQPNDE